MMVVKKTRKQLVDELKKENLTFHKFSLCHEGNYSASDADWNYKDVPHLHHVHQLAEAVQSYADDGTIANIVIQKILGLKIPLAVYIYENSPTSQVYYTASFFSVLIMESVYDEIAPNRTRVTTTYCIGSSRLFTWTFPILRWLIKRNYRDLMSTDIPMRERRGQLRSWGYEFKKTTPTYSYVKSINISGTNVTPPVSPLNNETPELIINEILPENGEYTWGRADAWGLRLVRVDNSLKLFARMCHHEGASLDKQPCKKDKVQCPWHGKLISPLAKFQLQDLEPQSSATKFHKITYVSGVLSIFLNTTVDSAPNTSACLMEESIV